MANEALSPLYTVENYITEVRTLLQDTVSPYRYSDASLLIALNLAFLEGRRLRPDLFIKNNTVSVPYHTTVSKMPVDIEQPFRIGFVYGTCAYALMRDQEDVPDQRASIFYADFYLALTGTRAPRMMGGTPGDQKPQGVKP